MLEHTTIPAPLVFPLYYCYGYCIYDTLEQELDQE